MRDSTKRPTYRLRGLPLALGLSMIAWTVLVWLLPWKVIAMLLVLLVAFCLTIALSPALRKRWGRAAYLLAERPDRLR